MSVANMMNALEISKVNINNPAGFFKNPATPGLGQLGTLQGNLNQIRGFMPSLPDIGASMSNYSSIVSNNVSARAATLTKDLTIASSAQRMYNSIATVDNTGGGFCDFVDGAFETLSKIGDFIGDAMDSITAAFQAVSGVIGDLLSAAFTITAQVVNQIAGALTSAFNTAMGAINSAITFIQNKIAEELASLAKMLKDLLDFSFLKNFFDFDTCGQNVLSAVKNTANIDEDALTQLATA